LEKWGVQKIFFSLAPLANHVLPPSLLESRRRPWTQCIYELVDAMLK